MRLIWLLGTLILMACSSPDSPEAIDQSEQVETVVETPALQEQFPDSGLLKSVDPEQIMTDDWSDDGDLELETEEKK